MRRGCASAATRAIPGRGVDVLSGITARAGAGIRVVHAEGVRITEHDANWSGDTVVLGDAAQNRARIQEAVKVARQADAIVARHRHQRVGLARSLVRPASR